MLERLKVENYAVVETADVAFGPGLNVITGETGSGKSVLVGALGLALGARADSSVVRDGAKEAVVTAEFDLSSARCATALALVAAALEDSGLPACEDGRLVLRRSVSSSGGGRVRVNDAAATAQTLRALARALVDVHGPHDNQSLLDERVQRALLDARAGFSAPDSVWFSYSRAWENLRAARSEFDRVAGDSSDPVSEIEELRAAVEELTRADPSAEDDDELPARHAAAAHAAELLERYQAVAELVGGDGPSAATALAGAVAELRAAARHAEDAGRWADEVEAIAARAQELARDVMEGASRLDADPDSLAALDARVTLLARLKRKYACASAAALSDARERKAARLAELEGRGARLAELAAAADVAERELARASAALTAARRAAAGEFAAAVTGELRGLGFARAEFGVAVEAREPDASGADRVTFAFAPNPGERSRPLADVASSGEAARVALAVKTVAADRDATPVLVFDEVDANVGGETGRAVGARLRSVAAHRQVIAITHLPQSAAFGERHLVVSKTVSGGRTRARVDAPAGEARVTEIARMLGGEARTDAVMRHARELLGNGGKKGKGKGTGR